MIYYVRRTHFYFLFHWEDCEHDEQEFMAFMFSVFVRLREARLI